MRLDKFLSNSGYGSRKDIKAMVKQGAITVDGKVAADSGMQVDENASDIRINGEAVSYKKYIYIMLNKPDGYVSATFDKKLPVVTELLGEYENSFEPYPVGRLDIDTEGLLILTNDGDMCHRLLSPKSHVKKKYYVISDIPPTQADADTFAKGVELYDGYVTLPGELEFTDNPQETYLTIYEGKFHQVKRMFEAVGKKVTYLRRVSMGNLELDSALALGDYRELTETEIKLLNEEM